VLGKKYHKKKKKKTRLANKAEIVLPLSLKSEHLTTNVYTVASTSVDIPGTGEDDKIKF
jgi:hypothetical protein